MVDPEGHGGDEQSPAQLHRALWALRPYLNELVIVGGWVPALYKRYANLPWHSRLSRTLEVDVLVKNDLTSRGRPSLAGQLEEMHFAPVDTGPSFAIWRGHGDGAETIEFLVPHTGIHRQIGTVRPVGGQVRIGAIQLPDLEILFEFTRSLSVSVHITAEPATLSVTVPLLGTFMVTRGVVFPQRKPPHRGAKDLLYIHDILAGGDAVTAMVRADVRSMRDHSGKAKGYVEKAATQVNLALGDQNAQIDAAAKALAEREGITFAGAEAAMVGYLRDYVEILREPG